MTQIAQCFTRVYNSSNLDMGEIMDNSTKPEENCQRDEVSTGLSSSNII